jgi:pyroglutamyl-peptidase
MSITILVTGFGPFPGAPFNPTGPLVERLARLRRPALGNVTIVPHIFPTSYTVVDRELPRLLARHKPDALLMFGLATRAKTIRIETRARNALALRDASGHRRLIQLSAASNAGAADFVRHLPQPPPPRVCQQTARDAGRYLCTTCYAQPKRHKTGRVLQRSSTCQPSRMRRRGSRAAPLTADDLVRAEAAC